MPGFDMGACDCLKGGCGLCLYTCCCSCLAYKEAADNISPDGNSNGIVYCLVTFPLGFGCCALTVLGDEVARKRGIEQGMAMSAIKSFFDCCTCYSCSVVHESRLYRDQGNQAVQTTAMQR